MPDDQVLIPQQTRRPPMGEEIRRERLGPENENRELTTTKSLDRLTPSMQINPMFLDSRHDAEVSNLLSRGIPAFTEGKGITKATNFEKLEALVWAMRDSDYFNFRYNPASQGNPKTVEETYSTREGDCDELSRVFVILAERMGITDLSQFYVNFKEKNTGEEYGHAALFYVEGRVMYIDPAFNRVFSFNRKFSSPEQVVKDLEFRKKLEGLRREVTGKEGSWGITEVELIKGERASEALYYFELGRVSVENASWGKAIDSFTNSVQFGMKNAEVFFQIGQAYDKTGDTKTAIKYFEKARDTKTTEPYYYNSLGRAFFAVEDYGNAIKAFQSQLKLDKSDISAVFELGLSYNNAAEQAMEKKDFMSATTLYLNAELTLKKFLGNNPTENREIAEQLLETIKRRKAEAKEKLR